MFDKEHEKSCHEGQGLPGFGRTIALAEELALCRVQVTLKRKPAPKGTSCKKMERSSEVLIGPGRSTTLWHPEPVLRLL